MGRAIETQPSQIAQFNQLPDTMSVTPDINPIGKQDLETLHRKLLQLLDGVSVTSDVSKLITLSELLQRYGDYTEAAIQLKRALGKIRDQESKKHKSIEDQEHGPIKREGKAIKILFVAANPKDASRIRVDEEFRSVDRVLMQSEFRDRFDIQQHGAVRVTDLQQLLLRHKPDIVHFSGHGSASNEIVLEDNAGKSRTVPVRALERLFSVLKDNIKCVVLNACYSQKQAEAIARNIDCVVGMSKSIGDKAAIGFSTAFYQALGFGRDIETAFELGRVQIDLEGLGEQNTPELLAINVNPKKVVLTMR